LKLQVYATSKTGSVESRFKEFSYSKIVKQLMDISKIVLGYGGKSPSLNELINSLPKNIWRIMVLNTACKQNKGMRLWYSAI